MVNMHHGTSDPEQFGSAPSVNYCYVALQERLEHTRKGGVVFMKVFQRPSR